VPPTDGVSAGALCACADLVTVYNSTAGLEAAARGKTVLVSGRPHFRGRGFTIDVDSGTHYRALIQSWSGGAALPAPAEASELARRYVHLFYLRYHVPMGWTTSPLEPPFALTIKSMHELGAGYNPRLDVVCDGIIAGRQVLLPRELAGAHPCER
jgi:Capsule polysaccharide biosynthesis protein